MTNNDIGVLQKVQCPFFRAYRVHAIAFDGT